MFSVSLLSCRIDLTLSSLCLSLSLSKRVGGCIGWRGWAQRAAQCSAADVLPYSIESYVVPFPSRVVSPFPSSPLPFTPFSPPPFHPNTVSFSRLRVSSTHPRVPRFLAHARELVRRARSLAASAICTQRMRDDGNFEYERQTKPTVFAWLRFFQAPFRLPRWHIRSSARRYTCSH